MWYDLHMHTVNSDGKNTADEMCRAAMGAGMAGIAITDHADMNFFESRNTPDRIKQSVTDIRAAQQAYGDKLKVMCGVELGEYLYAPKKAQTILSLADFDVVLCSVHFVPKARWPMPYNRIPFDTDGTDEELTDYLRLYFDLLSDTVDQYDFDVLAHITCPVRYMTHKHKRKSDVMPFEGKIRDILAKIIDRGIALEYNTGGFQQLDDVFALYRSMGGTMITLGSDAHMADSIARGFDTTAQKLRAMGFEHYCYYQNRTPHKVKL